MYTRKRVILSFDFFWQKTNFFLCTVNLQIFIKTKPLSNIQKNPQTTKILHLAQVSKNTTQISINIPVLSLLSPQKSKTVKT